MLFFGFCYCFVFLMGLRWHDCFFLSSVSILCCPALMLVLWQNSSLVSLLDDAILLCLFCRFKWLCFICLLLAKIDLRCLNCLLYLVVVCALLVFLRPSFYAKLGLLVFAENGEKVMSDILKILSSLNLWAKTEFKSSFTLWYDSNKDYQLLFFLLGISLINIC